MANRETIRIECTACGATGVYSGFAEPAGTAVVCVQCDGKGYIDRQYTRFTKRKIRRGIHTVQLSRGSFILSCGPVGEAISYDAFKAGKMPSRGKK